MSENSEENFVLSLLRLVIMDNLAMVGFQEKKTGLGVWYGTLHVYPQRSSLFHPERLECLLAVAVPSHLDTGGCCADTQSHWFTMDQWWCHCLMTINSVPIHYLYTILVQVYPILGPPVDPAWTIHVGIIHSNSAHPQNWPILNVMLQMSPLPFHVCGHEMERSPLQCGCQRKLLPSVFFRNRKWRLAMPCTQRWWKPFIVV